MSEALLEVQGLTKRYRGRASDAHSAASPRAGFWLARTRRSQLVLDGADLQVRAGETVALVGSSGAGKTTLARIVMRLIEPDAGSVRFAGSDLLAARGAKLRALRRQMQMVFQDPLAALNPRATVGRLLVDPLRVHRVVPAGRYAAGVAALLGEVGLDSELAQRYPHELSGGQRQRVNIARALATRPRLLVLDEPVSALDVSVRAQILNLLRDLQRAHGLAYLFITHDLAVVRAIADRVAVMAEGRVVEHGAADAVLASPEAAATRALLDAVPRLPAFLQTRDGAQADA